MMSEPVEKLFDGSDALLQALTSITQLPGFDQSDRLQVCRALCLLSIEHAVASRCLLAVGAGPSTVIIHRAQFEALVRAVWVFYCASDDEVACLQDELTPTSESLAARLPMLSKMLQALETVKQAAEPLRAFLEFKKYSWAALNSFVHAGAHALHRLRTGFPLELVELVVKQSNALVVMAHMQLAITTGSQDAVRWVATTADGFSDVLPPRTR
ncbi:hypothetical protein XAP3CFBP6996_008085 [Xanthomonas citri pv. fuscans CFBP 6996]|uniref:DUF6988 family protein n=1 Tax=Xanthomonas citri TaxID=346 RepID=UPI000C19FA46|nr:hypothetical protein [Xanthomonas citri]ATS51213.1 hypothetical protein XcfCFBP6992P_10120 [Xanthomonas citri pv. phaseoli var. fuscans]ATS56946.1 hypothetical protein XcfCFBP6994P_18830 [Xanthomonas citri pv. phaseoli var. fuscans]ATS59045.1 hypothetical protein XcfCFBP6996P_06900 [Xanthomonas citri pv. phaseoli var. fuscans]PTY31882.1 hypothetical protein XAP3CFBP6996_008085 [Xanthomonas citri pv. fuscans CFBP 6996]QWN15822.1 hypothetical protein DGN02_08115 [Xanthomonas citri]